MQQQSQQPTQHQARVFNPNEHLIQLRSREGAKDYLPVQWRLVWFREQCPEGTIETEEVLVDLDREVEEEAFVWNAEKRRSEKVVKHARGYARFRAIVTDGKGGRATGTKSETAASFPDYIEKAETGAIGRALAALGYGTQFAPEMDEAHRIVDAPVEQPTLAPSAANQSHAANNQQNQRPTHPAQAQTTNNQQDQRSITPQQAASINKLTDLLNYPAHDTLELNKFTYDKAAATIKKLNDELKNSRQQNRAS